MATFSSFHGPKIHINIYISVSSIICAALELIGIASTKWLISQVVTKIHLKLSKTFLVYILYIPASFTLVNSQWILLIDIVYSLVT